MKLKEMKQKEEIERHKKVKDYFSIDEMKQLEEWTGRKFDKIMEEKNLFCDDIAGFNNFILLIETEKGDRYRGSFRNGSASGLRYGRRDVGRGDCRGSVRENGNAYDRR